MYYYTKSEHNFTGNVTSKLTGTEFNLPLSQCIKSAATDLDNVTIVRNAAKARLS